MNRLRHIRNQSQRRLAAGVSAAGLVFSLSVPAGAQSLEREFEEGFELNPIEPAPAGDRFFLVPDGFSDPDAPEGAGPVRGMLFLHYSLAPSLTRTDNETGETADIVQRQLYAHAYGPCAVTPHDLNDVQDRIGTTKPPESRSAVNVSRHEPGVAQVYGPR